MSDYSVKVTGSEECNSCLYLETKYISENINVNLIKNTLSILVFSSVFYLKKLRKTKFITNSGSWCKVFFWEIEIDNVLCKFILIQM